jgi:hypothetical protein
MSPPLGDPSRLHRVVLRLYPSHVRNRYGPELLALLATSRTPTSDLLDVIRAALSDRLEEFVMTYLRTFAAIIGAFALFALGYAVNDLQHGLTELPRHWWSAAPAGLLLVSAALWFAPALRKHRHSHE